MKPCINCSNMLTDDAQYCYACNTEQKKGFDEFEIKPKQNSVFLIVLCILTILGCIITLISILFTNKAAAQLGIDYPSYFFAVSGLLTAGKLAGAVMMLLKKLKGLYIYTASSVVSMVFSVYSSFTIEYPEVSRTFSYIGLGLGIMFTILFIVLYWLPVNRKVMS